MQAVIALFSRDPAACMAITENPKQEFFTWFATIS